MTRSEVSENAAQNKADVRIILIGEHGVGKTSLIMSLLEDEFCDQVPSRIDNVFIPADVTPDRVVTSIHDYSSEQSFEELQREILEANVICIVYSVQDQSTIEKVTSYWLPLVKRILNTEKTICPVILVGNKSDETSSSKHMEKFEEIDTCIECSAKTMKNVSEIFYFAQKAVIYPSHPLYLPQERELTKKCKRALIRIFKLCDNDNDGLLNDEELNHFQMFVFVLANDFNASFCSFYYRKLIGRQETTWRVLRRFGYDNEIELAVDYLHPPLKVPKGCSIELTYEGFHFINTLFEKYDEDRDSCLSPSEMQNLFSVCITHPWTRESCSSVETNNKGWLTYNGYVCFWVMTTFLNVSLTMELLAYLGFNMRHHSQLDITRDRRIDIAEKSTSRTVFQCHVIGPKGAGKSVFLQSFAGRSLSVNFFFKKRFAPYVMNSVKVKGATKYLLLHEVDVLSPDETLTSYEKSADVIVLLYDASDSNSFSYVATIYLKYFYRTKVPCIVVATKSEYFESEQEYGQQPGDFCRNHSLPQPILFRHEDIGHTDAPIYTQIATMAVYPHLKKVYYLQDSNLLSRITFGAAVAALAAFLLYKNI
ncbi:unnamed protein product [Dracunculus medinensis]|uniref:Mitochondrial Rho GTPase n=1 Tax=Dracunculus medinensis TaxID=318479 RepID=A0A0N4U448_DRAME|nr:unnamed protein product [Dracunculus medinensis]